MDKFDIIELSRGYLGVSLLFMFGMITNNLYNRPFSIPIGVFG